MNAQEIGNLLRIVGASVFAMLATKGYLTQDQSKALMTDITTIAPAFASAAAIVWSIYAHWNMKKVPETSIAIAPNPGTVNPLGSIGANAQITGKIVGALLIGFLVLAPASSRAQNTDANGSPATFTVAVQSSCDLLTLLKGLTLANIKARLGACSTADLSAAIKDAAAQSPPDNVALACYTPVLAIVSNLQTGVGLITLAQQYRDAKRARVLQACNSWALDTGAP